MATGRECEIETPPADVHIPAEPPLQLLLLHLGRLLAERDSLLASASCRRAWSSTWTTLGLTGEAKLCLASACWQLKLGWPLAHATPVKSDALPCLQHCQSCRCHSYTLQTL